MLQFTRRSGSLVHQVLRCPSALSSTAAFSTLPALQAASNSSNQAERANTSYTALAAGLAAAGALTYYQSSAEAEVPVPAPTTAPAEAPVPVAVDTSDLYKRPTELKGLPKKIVLYQYEICPFCYKVKAFLDYHKIPYSVIEVNPLTKAEVKWSETYRKVPIIKLDDEVVVDSSRIISRLAAEVEASQKPQQQETVPSAPASSSLFSWLTGSSSEKAASSTAPEVGGCSEEDEEKWRAWVDSKLVKIVTANIYRSWSESWQTFGYITEQGNWGWATREMAKTTGAVMMWQVGKRLPAKYGIEGDLREALYSCVADFLAAVGEKPFLGGEKPNLADLAVFGVLRTVVGTDTFKDVMASTDISLWYDRMRQAVGPSARVPLEE